MWIESHGAFRTGGVTSANWDLGEVGTFSFASGFDCKASGSSSVAMGLRCKALEEGAVAFALMNG